MAALFKLPIMVRTGSFDVVFWLESANFKGSIAKKGTKYQCEQKRRKFYEPKTQLCLNWAEIKAEAGAARRAKERVEDIIDFNV
jgi:hypothetical protein